ncbi:GTP cyclohydrolase I FolE [candidate division WWE3 bacterium RIFOXYC1_FULL_39_7]|uniref:GTP cyclohydrolase 1 n=2 Tax=Katanobacteria TaxID=422282 RepID=A0A1F4X882_UNCKA|nr:MAG: GTP cyclohydrolase I FolE [candidate division WWE3 bacterium RIFOXYC1_FULL_39_7]OGC77876.1 MAG: GTP cyclohydrolase I FolE [candidate division WWE3 bacterium RIFOXYD1_FULL_39_9]
MKKLPIRNDDSDPRVWVYKLIEHFGEDTSRPGLLETPDRVIRMYNEILGGYKLDEAKLYKVFQSNGYGELITVANIDFYSLCEHHMAPFYGKVHIGYVPDGHVLGLSKFARIVDMFARRLQIQEGLTKQIADSLERHLNPNGVIVHVEAEHLCVNMRGVKKRGFVTKTTVRKGVFRSDGLLVEQFFRDINGQAEKDG